MRKDPSASAVLVSGRREAERRLHGLKEPALSKASRRTIRPPVPIAGPVSALRSIVGLYLRAPDDHHHGEFIRADQHAEADVPLVLGWPLGEARGRTEEFVAKSRAQP